MTDESQISTAGATKAPVLTTIPALTTEPPVVTTEPPVVTTEPPVVTSQPPVVTTESLVVTTQPPLITTEPPAVTTEPPIVTTEPLVITTESLVITTGPPVITTEPPVITTEPPVVRTDPLVITTESLVITTGLPVITTEPPIIITEPPVATTEPLVITTESLVITTGPQVITTEPPVITTEPPVVTTEPPVVTTEPSIVTTGPPVIITGPQVITTGPQVITTEPPVITTGPPITQPSTTQIAKLPFYGQIIFVNFMNYYEIYESSYSSFVFTEETDFDTLSNFILSVDASILPRVERLALVKSKIFINLLTRLRFTAFAYKQGLTAESNEALRSLFTLTNYNTVITSSYVESNWRSNGQSYWNSNYLTFDWNIYSYSGSLTFSGQGFGVLFFNYFKEITSERSDDVDVTFILQSVVLSFDFSTGSTWDFRFQTLKAYFDAWLNFYRRSCATTDTCKFPRLTAFLNASDEYFFTESFERILAYINVLVYQERTYGISITEGTV